jgi:hypothetical protein
LHRFGHRLRAWRSALGSQLLLTGRPGGEQLQGVGGGCAVGRGVDVEQEAGFGGQFERLEVEVELPDDRVAEPLRPLRW